MEGEEEDGDLIATRKYVGSQSQRLVALLKRPRGAGAAVGTP